MYNTDHKGTNKITLISSFKKTLNDICANNSVNNPIKK